MATRNDVDDSGSEAALGAEDIQLNERFMAQCKALKWGTQNDLATRLGVSPRTISAIFTQTRVPGSRLLRTAAHMGMDVLYVLTGETSKADALSAQLEREIDRYKTVLRSVVAIVESELPGTRASVTKEAPRPKLSKEQEMILAKFANADTQLRAIVMSILERVEPPATGPDQMPPPL